jgi:hypothetical protein
MIGVFVHEGIAVNLRRRPMIPIWKTIVAVIMVTVAAQGLGCNIDLPKASEITDARVIGTRIKAPDDSTLVWPKKGGRATLLWKVVYPKLEQSNDTLQSMFLICTPAPVSVDTPICLEFFNVMNTRKGLDQDLSDVIGIPRLSCDDLDTMKSEHPEKISALPFQLVCIDKEPNLEISIPEDTTSDERLVMGVLCDRGKAFIDPSRKELFGCDLEKDGEEIKSVFYVPLQTEDTPPNHHPRLDDDAIELDGEPWSEVKEADLVPYLLPSDSDQERFDCAKAVDDGVLTEVKAEKQTFTVKFDRDNFEKYDDANGDEQSEELKIAHYATSGNLKRDDSIVRSEWKNLSFDLEWKPPKEIPKTGLLTRFFFTVRDGRGGFDSAMRAFCVKGK